MPNIVDKGIFKEYTRTEDEQKLFDLEDQVKEQSILINKLLALVEANASNNDDGKVD